MLGEIQTTKAKKLLETVTDIITLRARFLESIRAQKQVEVVTEAWKQVNRENVAKPMLAKQQMMNSILSNPEKTQKSLKPTEDKRVTLMKALNTAEDNATSSRIESWKVKNIEQRTEAIKNKHAIICDINEKKEGTQIKPAANRQNVLAEIRNEVNQKQPNTAPVVENWRQTERDNKSKLYLTKKMVLVDVEAPTAKALLKNVEKTDMVRHTDLLNAIRTEKLPAWKESVNCDRINTIQSKNKVNNEICSQKCEAICKTLKNTQTVQENKINLMKDIRCKSGNFTEAWKESQSNDRATAIGCKGLINEDITSKKASLKLTKSQPELKTETLKELRMKADMCVPKWKEEILDEQSIIKGNRNQVICDISKSQKSKKPLTKTSSFNESKAKCLSEIRRPQPVEAWKEAERQSTADLYTVRREVVHAIADKKFSLENSKSQAELRSACLVEIRTKNTETVVPVWKEKKLAKRAEVFTNKMILNRSIENLKIM